MNLPRVLVIDDELSPSQGGSLLRRSMLRSCDMRDSSSSADVSENESLAVAYFCSGEESEGVYTYEVIREAIAEGEAQEPWNLILLDVTFGKKEHFGEEVRVRLLREYPSLPIVMLTSRIQDELQNPDVPYLSKEGLTRRDLARQLIEHGRLSSSHKRKLLELGNGEIAESPAFLNVLYQAYLYADSDAAILLLGETGVGKEVVARYIHRLSKRSEGPFVGENMAGVGAHDSAMLNMILFGRRKNYPNRGDMEETGLFGSADGGTLFLDEIAELPLPTQSNFLRVLQERRYRRLGEPDERTANFRLLTATLQNLEHLIKTGVFREDLFNRIAQVTLCIPPLRERREDIGPLAEHFLQTKMGLYGKRGIKLCDDARETLIGLDFPGNVRQLENLIQQLVLQKGNNAVIFASDIYKVGGETSRRIVSVPRSAARKKKESLTLTNLHTQLAALSVSPNDPSLVGSLNRLEDAFSSLKQRLAGAALKKSWNIRSDKPVNAEAVRLLYGDRDISGETVPYTLQRILGDKRSKKISSQQVNTLINAWKSAEQMGKPQEKNNLEPG